MTPKTSYDELHQKVKALESKILLTRHFLTHSNDEIQTRLDHPEAFADIITTDKKMISIFKYVEHIASTSQPVLITGETGAGKELIAKTIHNLSELKGDFVPVNVSGLDENIFADTFFGHVKGAFTGAETARRGLIEKATGGTLLLDEIGDLHASSQVKLLRVLQEAEYMPLGQDKPKRADVRVVSTTNKDLWKLQKASIFREDLNFRIRTHHVHIPPLRERRGDIKVLLHHFLGVSAKALNKEKPKPPRELEVFLNTYRFPGNIRELQAMVFDAVSRSTSKHLSLETFKNIARQQHPPSEPEVEKAVFFASCQELPSIQETTRLLVEEAMKRAEGNQTVAARMIGISQQALSKRLKSKP